ncbi:MAG: hypothetical protein HOU01_17380 [Streptomycetaceae bacterium]|nr:hypothetical protein [Streptomycetaceae bacterium]
MAAKKVKDTTPYAVSGPGGLEAGITTRTTAGAERGLSGVRCTEPAPITWLVGPGPADATVTLYLANADKAPAMADVLVYAAEGMVSGDKGLGLELAPGEHREIDLRTLAPSADIMAVSVTTVLGRVAVAARAELRGKGVDWIPSAQPPATRVVVPGIPGGGGTRELLVAAPGDRDASVQVRAVSQDATYAMKGRETLDVPAGAVASMDVTTGTGGEAAALVLTSETPIVAGVVVAGTGNAQDVAFTAGTAPLDLGATVADNGKGSRLVLTAPSGPGKVSVQVVPGGRPAEVSIPAGRTKEVKLSGKGTFGVVVTPVSGQVYGGRVIQERAGDGVLVTIRPLAPGRTWTLVPTLRDDPSVVLP